MSYGHAPRGRQRHAEPIALNVYDLSPANDALHAAGLGLYHSGLEVHGREYTFSSGGVFSHAPKAAPGVKFRGAVVLGTVRMSSREVEDVVGRLRDRFPGDSYHILKRNCNSFAEELCMELTGGQRPPGWVNRLARLGACVSCCLPASLTDGSPVNEAGVGTSMGGRGGGGNKRTPSFAGTGRSLGGNGNGGGGGGGGGAGGGSGGADERRKLQRAAALKRLEQRQKASASAAVEPAATGSD